MASEIDISVCLITYNHVKYIRQAIESILSQKTNYSFELIIHDDASTDGTTQIVGEYARKYPDIIIPIIQETNKYSQGIRIFNTYALPKSRGKYISFLEGDDYWTDDAKLQKQVDFLETHEEYVAVVHKTKHVDVRTGETCELPACDYNKEITLEDIVENGIHSFHLNSCVYRKKIWDNEPSFMEITKGFFGDLPLRLLLKERGKIMLLPEVMSVYRYKVPGSDSVRTESKEKTILTKKKIIELYEAVDKYQGYNNHSIFQKYVNYQKFEILLLTDNFSELYKEPYISILKERDKVEQFKIFIKDHCKPVYLIYKNIRKR